MTMARNNTVQGIQSIAIRSSVSSSIIMMVSSFLMARVCLGVSKTCDPRSAHGHHVATMLQLIVPTGAYLVTGLLSPHYDCFKAATAIVGPSTQWCMHVTLCTYGMGWMRWRKEKDVESIIPRQQPGVAIAAVRIILLLGWIEVDTD